MRYTPPPSSLFSRNRENFRDKMLPGHIAVFFANDLIVSNSDAHYPFQQNSNTYYLSGLDQEKVILLLFPDAPNEAWKEMLFIVETKPDLEVWNGRKYSKEEARTASGIKNTMYFRDFWTVIRSMLPFADGIYIDSNESESQREFTFTKTHLFAEKMRREFPGFRMERAAPILRYLRMFKSADEIHQLRVACSITEKAFRRVLKFVKPDVYEFEIEAEVLYEFLQNRASGAAYPSIIGSGGNACILHYVENNAQCKNGELILFDFGAKYGNYCADMSRVIPVNGRFTKRQSAVYNAVLSVMRQATELLEPGLLLVDYNREVGSLMTEALLELDLLKKKEVAEQNEAFPAYKKFLMHGISHHIGLDTHDLCDRFAVLEAGMVLTVEPGIYIPEENMGVRLENVVVIGEGQNEDLMQRIPIEVEEIEDLMML